MWMTFPNHELSTILEQRCAIAPSYARKLVDVMQELQRRRQVPLRRPPCHNGWMDCLGNAQAYLLNKIPEPLDHVVVHLALPRP